MDTPQENPGHEGTRRGGSRVPRARRERQILAAAAEQFGLRGYDAASVAAVAAQVGVTKTLVHHYFGGKHDLHLACLAWAASELRPPVEAALGRPAPGGDPERALRSFFAALEGRRVLWLLLADALQQGTGELIPAVGHCRTAVDRIAASCTDGLLLAATDKDTAESAALRQAWWGLVTGMVRWWTRHPEQSARWMADRCARLLAITSTVSR